MTASVSSRKSKAKASTRRDPAEGRRVKSRTGRSEESMVWECQAGLTAT